MKKLIALVLALALMLSFGGCANIENNKNDIIVEDSLILVQSVDALEKPYKNFLWAENWSENGWVSGDGMSISHKLCDIDKEIPQITYGDDFEIHYGEGSRSNHKGSNYRKIAQSA